MYMHVWKHKSEFGMDDLQYIKHAVDFTDPASAAFPGRRTWVRPGRGGARDIFLDKSTRTIGIKYKAGADAGKIETVHKLKEAEDIVKWAKDNDAPKDIIDWLTQP